MRTFGANGVIIPIVSVQYFIDRNHVGWKQNAIAPRLIINCAPPIRIAKITLITSQLGGIRHAPAANLHAAVDKAFGAGELEFEAQDEIGELAPGAEEIVFFDSFG